MRTVVLTEYAPSDEVRLGVEERDALRAMVPGLVVQPVPGQLDGYQIVSGSTVGIVRVGDLTVELRPKIGVAAVLFLVSYALDPKSWRAAHANLLEEANLAEALIPLFAQVTERALRPGLLHGYRRQEDALVTVRGRIRMADQFRARAGLPLPVEVTWDEFTPDILENQLLRAAVDVLGRLHLRHASSRRALAGLHQQLHGITSGHWPGRHVPEPEWTRLNDRYRPAVSLARLVLAGTGVEARAGGVDASAFLVDMNAVFERFVRVALRERLGLDQRAFPAGASGRALRLDAERQVALQPDLSWWSGQRCLFAGDCKYKRPGGSIPNADLDQALAYLTALQLHEGLLVYAAGEDVDHSVTIPFAEKRVHVRTVDVARPPHEVLTQVEELAGLVSALAIREGTTAHV